MDIYVYVYVPVLYALYVLYCTFIVHPAVGRTDAVLLGRAMSKSFWPWPVLVGGKLPMYVRSMYIHSYSI